ncbi:MAG: aldo/keto reductase [Isosphaeraceae bacterium]
MSQHSDTCPNRRRFLQAAAMAATAASVPEGGLQAQEPGPGPQGSRADFPRRLLGKTGVEITMIDQGAVRGQAVDSILPFAYSQGIRTFDTAKVYGTEGNFRKWFERDANLRKSIFLITKDMPKTASQMTKMVDERLEALGTDYIDLFFIHGLGDDHTLDGAIDLVTGQEFKEAADKIRKSGKARFIGFSTHHKDRAPIIEAAAKANIIDAIMLQYRPWLDKDSPLNKAIDAAHKADIGLISMKQIAGNYFGDKPTGNILDDVKKRVPMLNERKLTPFQGLLHAIWSDERISSICVSMRNFDQIKENVDAARRFEPLKEADMRQLRDATLAHNPTLCADCDGRCMAAAATKAELGVMTRYLTYHQHLGDRAEARRLYAELPPEAKDWAAADLAAARQACPGRLDFARLLAEVERHLA